MLVTKMIKTIILQLSPTNFVFKMCHQHRRNRFAELIAELLNYSETYKQLSLIGTVLVTDIQFSKFHC